MDLCAPAESQSSLGVRLSLPLDGPPPADEMQRLISVVLDSGIVVLSDQTIPTLQTLAQALGDAEMVLPIEHRLPGSTTLRLQSNIEGFGVNGGGMYWHADGSWLDASMDLTLLYCVVAPGHGGTTKFVDTAALVEHLSPGDRSTLETKIGTFPNRATLADDLAFMKIESPEMLAIAEDRTHPLVRIHPHTGRPALILNEQWCRGVEGLDPHEAEEYLASLSLLVDRSAFHYVHTWQPGDLLIWDNHRVLHRASPTPPGNPKITVRARIPRIWPNLIAL